MYDVLTLWNFLQDFYSRNVAPGGIPKQLTVDEYGYPVTFSAFNQESGNAASNGVQPVNINTNADFWLLGIRYTWQGAAALNATLQVIDTGSNKPFWANPVPIAVAASPGGAPVAGAVANSGSLMTCAWPRLLPANTNLSVLLTGVHTASDAAVCRVFFSGVNVKNYGAAAQFVG
jgi:hypothetical protein